LLYDQGVAGLKVTPASDVDRSRTKALIASLTASEREGFIKIADAFVATLATSTRSMI